MGSVRGTISIPFRPRIVVVVDVSRDENSTLATSSYVILGCAYSSVSVAPLTTWPACKDGGRQRHCSATVPLTSAHLGIMKVKAAPHLGLFAGNWLA